MPTKDNLVLVFCAEREELGRLASLFQHAGQFVASALSMRELFSLLEEDSFDAVLIADTGTGGVVPSLLPEIRKHSPDSKLLVIKEMASRKDILDSLNNGCSYFIEDRYDDIAGITSRIINGAEANHPVDSHAPEFRPHPELSPRETDILYEMLSGKTNREIGKTLSIQEKTVKNHLWKIYRKYQVNNRTELFGMLISECPFFRPVRENMERRAAEPALH
jgi:DNA-binding NarL/FixJ family response regulator